MSMGRKNLIEKKGGFGEVGRELTTLEAQLRYLRK